MLGFKLIDRLVAKSLIGPYILFFFIVEFVLIMQFLWKYIDEILGKGFSIFELLQMIFYYGVTIIPMGIPLTVLISSVMVYGEMSEKYELVSMKSAGVSLLRIFKAGIFIAILTAMFSLFASNYLKPIANFKFQSTFLSLRKKKPTLSIEEGVFNKDFNGYTIRVGHKGKDNVSIEDVLVYDHSNAQKGEINVISAKSGKMYTTANGDYFIMKLFDGEHTNELPNKKTKKSKEVFPLMRTNFKEWTKVFDMTAFNKSGSINVNRNKHDLMNSKQILVAMDSLDQELLTHGDKNIHLFGAKRETENSKLERIKEQQNGIQKSIKNKVVSSEKKTDTTSLKNEEMVKQFKKQVGTISKNKKQLKSKFVKNNRTNRSNNKGVFSLMQNDSIKAVATTFYSTIDPTQLKSLTTAASSKSRILRDRMVQNTRTKTSLVKSLNKFKLRLYQQYSWALICIIFLFIGAPLGSIVKKGGFGFPVLIAISFFIAFVLLLITGEKLLKAGSVSPFIAAWLPCLVLTPIAFLVTFLALRDLKMGDLLSFKTMEISDPEENIRQLEASEDLLSNH